VMATFSVLIRDHSKYYELSYQDQIQK